uniref:C2H2-type domain-containing protein n=1 Tax=Steinernema glaseri TaxID=37863 RepID=A0A1I7ZDJ2_9BILA
MKATRSVCKKRSSSRSTSLSLCSLAPKRLRTIVTRRVASESDAQSSVSEAPSSSMAQPSMDDLTASPSTDSKLNLLLGNCTISSTGLGCSQCGEVFEKPLLLHAHMAFEHLSDTVLCSHCGKTSAYLHRNHVCSVCKKFFAHLAEHELTHFRDKTGRHALMECPKCYRSFETVFDLKQHCLQAHGQRPGRQFGCFGCGEHFSSRHIRDHHFVSHIKSVVDNVMENMEDIQERMGQQLQNNQCPLCHYAMSSRKSFRFHIIYRHILADMKQMRSLLGPAPYDQNEMKLVMKIINLGGSPHSLNGAFDCDENGNPLGPRMRGKKPHPLPPVVIPDFLQTRVKEEANDSGCDLSGGESPDSQAEEVAFQEPKIKEEQMDVAQPLATEAHEQPWVGFRNRLVNICLRKRANSGEVECSACDMVFPRMYDFELHLISKHVEDFSGRW